MPWFTNPVHRVAATTDVPEEAILCSGDRNARQWLQARSTYQIIWTSNHSLGSAYLFVARLSDLLNTSLSTPRKKKSKPTKNNSLSSEFNRYGSSYVHWHGWEYQLPLQGGNNHLERRKKKLIRKLLLNQMCLQKCTMKNSLSHHPSIFRILHTSISFSACFIQYWQANTAPFQFMRSTSLVIFLKF